MRPSWCDRAIRIKSDYFLSIKEVKYSSVWAKLLQLGSLLARLNQRNDARILKLWQTFFHFLQWLCAREAVVVIKKLKGLRLVKVDRNFAKSLQWSESRGTEQNLAGLSQNQRKHLCALNFILTKTAASKMPFYASSYNFGPVKLFWVALEALHKGRDAQSLFQQQWNMTFTFN